MLNIFELSQVFKLITVLVQALLITGTNGIENITIVIWAHFASISSVSCVLYHV